MSNNNNWENYDDEDDDNSGYRQPRSEEDLLKDFRKRERLAEKRIKELESELNTFKAANRESSIKSILEKKGVPAKASHFILKDIEGEVTEESINNWLTNYGELFNIKADPEGQVNTQVSDSDRAALRQQDELTQGAITPNQLGETYESQLDSIDDEATFWKFVHSDGKAN